MLNQQQEDIAIVLAEIDTLERQCREALRQGANGGRPDAAVGAS